ncbi:MAG: YlxM family DNA-binding protein [Oscillospiraceae bacterium]
MNTEKDLHFSILLDYYADMLTDKQRDVIDLYYNEDLSLAEIAEHENITRQGVRDSIKRGEQTMLELEDKFHLVERSRKYNDIIEEVGKLAADIRNECAYCGNPKGIVKRAEYLVKLADENKDLF